MAELGAYGLRLRGFPADPKWLVAQSAAAPLLHIRVRVQPTHDGPSRVNSDSADLALLGGGRLQAERGQETMRYLLPRPVTDEEMVHPYLAPAAALRWQWAAREALHAGVISIGEGAVLLFGAKGSGKSTTLAWLADQHGMDVLSDDLAVIDAGQILTGPRTLDLRRGGPASIPGQPVRGGERRRIQLPPAPPTSGLRGCIVLAWGDVRSFEPVPPAERLALIAAQRSFPLPGDPGALLDLAALPMYRFIRPRSLDERAGCARALVERFA